MSQRLPQSLCWQAPVLHTERCQLLPCPRRELGAGQPPVPQAPAPHPHPPSPAPAAGACAGAAPAPGAAGPCSPPYPIPYPAHGWVATVGTAQPPNAAPAAHLPGEPWRAAGAAKPAQGRGRLRGRKMVFSQPWLIPAATAAPLPSAAWTGAAGAAQPHGLWGTWRGPGSISCPLTGGLAPPPHHPQHRAAFQHAPTHQCLGKKREASGGRRRAAWGTTGTAQAAWRPGTGTAG